jgi:hypothetical protein
VHLLNCIGGSTSPVLSFYTFGLLRKRFSLYLVSVWPCLALFIKRDESLFETEGVHLEQQNYLILVINTNLLSSNKFYIRECRTVNSIIELIQDLCVGSEHHESQFCATVADRWLRASKDLV